MSARVKTEVAQRVGDAHRGLVQLALLGAQRQPGDVLLTRAQQHPLHGDRQLVECGGGEQPLLVGTLRLGQQVDLQRRRMLGRAQPRGGGVPAVDGVLGRAQEHGVSVALAHRVAEPDGGVAAVVGAEHLSDAAFDVAEEADRRLARCGEAGAELTPGEAEPVDDHQDVGGAQVDAELVGGRLFEVVGLVDDQHLVLAQRVAAAGSVGEEKGMVGDHDRRRLGGAPRGHHEAAVVLPVGACRTQAVTAVGLDVAPECLVDTGEVELAAIAVLGLRQPGEQLQLEPDAVQVRSVRAGVGRAQEAMPAPQAELVVAPLEERGGDGCADDALDHRQVAGHQLLLQGDGSGGHHRAAPVAAVQRQRHQVGQRLAHARPGLDDEAAAALHGLGHGAGHLQLRLAQLVRAVLGGQRTLGAEQRRRGGDDVGRRRSCRRRWRRGAPLGAGPGPSQRVAVGADDVGEEPAELAARLCGHPAHLGEDAGGQRLGGGAQVGKEQVCRRGVAERAVRAGRVRWPAPR